MQSDIVLKYTFSIENKDTVFFFKNLLLNFFFKKNITFTIHLSKDYSPYEVYSNWLRYLGTKNAV